MLDKRDERLYAKFDALETKIDALNSTVSAQICDLKTYFTTAFSDSHFFNRGVGDPNQHIPGG